MKPSRLFCSVLLLASLFLTGCVTRITTDILQNPPPAEKFVAFNRFEIGKITLGPGHAGQAASERALAKIQENVDLKATPLLAGWKDTSATATPARTLVFTPVITDIKFVSGGKRTAWIVAGGPLAGAIAGSSAVILKVTITEKETGKVIGTPIFYSRTAAMAGAWTFGAMDNVMLVRIAGRFTDYLAGNYAAAVGGPTGADKPD